MRRHKIFNDNSCYDNFTENYFYDSKFKISKLFPVHKNWLAIYFHGAFCEKDEERKQLSNETLTVNNECIKYQLKKEKEEYVIIYEP